MQDSAQLPVWLVQILKQQHPKRRLLNTICQSITTIIYFLLLCSVSKLCTIPCNPMDYSMPLSSTIFQSLLKFMSIESVKLSNHLIFCHPFLFMPSIFPIIRVFSSELALRNRWPKHCSFSPSNEYSGLISFRMDWFDLLAV